MRSPRDDHERWYRSPLAGAAYEARSRRGWYAVALGLALLALALVSLGLAP